MKTNEDIVPQDVAKFYRRLYGVGLAQLPLTIRKSVNLYFLNFAKLNLCSRKTYHIRFKLRGYKLYILLILL